MIEGEGGEWRMLSKVDLNVSERKRGGNCGVMGKMKHERERQTIRDTNKMGKYKLRLTREREQGDESRERIGGEADGQIMFQPKI